jgi:hypothetical protein
MPLGLPNPALGGILFSVLLPTLLLIFHSYRVMDADIKNQLYPVVNMLICNVKEKL